MAQTKKKGGKKGGEKGERRKVSREERNRDRQTSDQFFTYHHFYTQFSVSPFVASKKSALAPFALSLLIIRCVRIKIELGKTDSKNDRRNGETRLGATLV